MDTIARPGDATPDSESELNLLLAEDRAGDLYRWKRAAAGSAVVHVIAILVALSIPDTPVREVPPSFVVHVTPLFIPTDLTQKAANKGKISKELTAEAIPARPKLRAPAPAPAARQTPPPAPVPFTPPAPVQHVAQAAPKPAVAEPPKIEAQLPPQQPVARFTAPPQPAPPAQQPRLELQNAVAPPGPASGGQPRPAGGLAVPNPSVQEAIRAVTHGATGTQSVGDIGTDEGGVGPGLNLPPSAGRPRSNLELKSDPMGVDFRPYLLQVLAAVRRNWFAVYPEAARLGQRGQVTLQFAIVKQGMVTKVVFSTESGAKALDQAAVAAISASNPLPPLPPEFRGERIVLQMTFQYNMPAR